ncbi:MAG TPA: fibronectin type III domain-containing protein [Polyangiaceae bacterium]
MHVKRERPYPARVFTARPGPNRGTVILRAAKAGNRAGYEWAYSLDAEKTWVSVPFTVKATTTVKGLKPGSTVWFRYRPVTKGGAGDWGDPVPFMVE